MFRTEWRDSNRSARIPRRRHLSKYDHWLVQGEAHGQKSAHFVESDLECIRRWWQGCWEWCGQESYGGCVSGFDGQGGPKTLYHRPLNLCRFWSVHRNFLELIWKFRSKLCSGRFKIWEEREIEVPLTKPFPQIQQPLPALNHQKWWW